MESTPVHLSNSERLASEAPQTTLAAKALKLAPDGAENKASRIALSLEELDRVPDGSQRGHKTNLYKMSTKDEILSVFRVGERVRLTKTIRNDGTYPHARTGDTLVEAGAEGYVRKIGDFLQTIRVYEVNFIEEGLTFGCREAELESAL
ncbi:MAG: nitrogen fixation protein NifZ, partial [Sulfuricurvum sp.]|nr:nitrogen fixation protein NifZ [Sulfuricurvum sp.]